MMKPGALNTVARGKIAELHTQACIQTCQQRFIPCVQTGVSTFKPQHPASNSAPRPVLTVVGENAFQMMLSHWLVAMKSEIPEPRPYPFCSSSSRQMTMIPAMNSCITEGGGVEGGGKGGTRGQIRSCGNWEAIAVQGKAFEERSGVVSRGNCSGIHWRYIRGDVTCVTCVGMGWDVSCRNGMGCVSTRRGGYCNCHVMSAHLDDDENSVARAEIAHVAVDAGHHVGHGLADGDQHAEQLLRAVAATRSRRNVDVRHPVRLQSRLSVRVGQSRGFCVEGGGRY